MRRLHERLRWIGQPQGLIGFVVLCLGVAAFGGMMRSVHASQLSQRVASSLPQRHATIAPTSRPDCTVVPCIALTFDDGPDEKVTPVILDILAREHAKGTFFVLGQRIKGREALVQREYREGHEIGNHSWSHPHLSSLSPSEVADQLHRTQAAVAAAGVPAPRLLRPPYGDMNDMVTAHNQLTVVRWNVDPQDWDEKDPAKTSERLLNQVHPGGIVVLHDTQPTTADVLHTVLPTLKSQYQLVTVSQLLDLTPGDQGQYFGR